MTIPLIDFSTYDENDEHSISLLAEQINTVLSTIGFMSVTNLGIDTGLLKDIFSLSHDFFSSSPENKKRSTYLSAKENFGYQALAEENLNPNAPADLKETFTMRNIINAKIDDSRWPDEYFRENMCHFFQEALQAAHKIQRVLAKALEQQDDFFIQYHNGENVTLRLLHYPALSPSTVDAGQLGAGAHTDYGLITLLFQDEIGGLEVLDKNNEWIGVEYVESAIIINCGDLLERWSNGRYRSTLHRVQPKVSGQERFSVALFVDPDTDTPVSVIDSCITDEMPARFPPITAGEYILEKLRATHQTNKWTGK